MIGVADAAMYILDTNTISELSPEKSSPNSDVVAWLRRNGADFRPMHVPVCDPANAPPPG